MYEAKAAMFLYSVSPVHMGAGTAIGAIDNPIQRERHTCHPMMAGSGIKGALRHYFKAAGNDPDLDWIRMAFGPETDRAGDHAGALSFSDAQLVAFPVRSARHSFVYVTSPATLARTRRLCILAGVEGAETWDIPSVSDGQAQVGKADVLSGGRLILETFELEAQPSEVVKRTAAALAAVTFPEGAACRFFQEKFSEHLVVLSEAEFAHFVQYSVIVEPHVRISDETGTADGGGLFYSENVPPEACFVCLAMSTQDRRGKVGEGGRARDILQALVKEKAGGGLQGRHVQIGGDATCGRGQVVLSFTGRDV